jgi:hypothetical protein
MLAVLREVAEAHAATPSQVALAWLIRRPNVVVIPGASSVAQVEVNAAAADIELSEDEDVALVAVSDAFHPVGAASVLPDLIRERVSGWLDRVRGSAGARNGGGGPDTGGRDGHGNNGQGNNGHGTGPAPS